MRKVNVHYFAVAVAFSSLFLFNWRYGSETFIFFGFAENKEMEIRLEHPVSIEKINVSPGTKVEKGDILLEVMRSSLEEEQSNLSHEIAKLGSQYNIWESDIRGSISRLEAQKQAKKAEILTQIEQLESQMSINQSLIKDLKSIQPAKDKSGSSPHEVKIKGLKKELRLAIAPLNSEIRKLKNELNAVKNPLKIQMNKLEENLGFTNQEAEKLTILAPSDGVVGSVFCKVGEQFSSFNTLLTFYEENPTQVKGYVHESLILNVRTGDSVIVQSGVQSSSFCKGKVIGMGSRIVEIPDRLRKNPTFKTYGREVQIQIPANNDFLQKEKVVLKLPEEKTSNKKIIKVLTPPKTSAANLGGITEKGR